ncbi:MAG: hypothetical protein H6555_00140 [Lewinellaceae bacterium]|nr:hypothetical protein [Lewinellaceae bacterium]
MEDKTSQKPTWLQMLEAESWQAELIVSGAAIYGSLQLPELIRQGINYTLLWIYAELVGPVYIFFWYLFIGAAILMLSFILHFVLRSLWIGLVGLASVYPKGINVDSENYSRHFLEAVRREFPDLGQFNQQLDALCSVVFAACFNLAMVILSITINLFLLFVVVMVITRLVPSIPFLPAFWGTLAVLLFPSTFMGLLNIKSMRNRPWVQRIQFPITRTVSRGLYNIFYMPMNYIQFTFATNLPMGRYMAYLGGYFALVMVVAVPLLWNSNGTLLIGDLYFYLDDRQDRKDPDLYADTASPDYFPLRPQISSATIKESSLSLFIPQLGRDKKAMEGLCPEVSTLDSLSQQENRRRSRDARLTCMREHYQLAIDEVPVVGHSFFLTKHPQGRVDGITATIPLDSLAAGGHLLRITFPEKNADGDHRQAYIPFWYEPPID